MRRRKLLMLLFGLCSFTVNSFAQSDTATIATFQKIFGTTQFKVDTTAVPEDSLTQKIRLLRKVRGPLNMDIVIKNFIQGQEENDKTHPKEYFDRLLEECQNGNAHRLIENVLINLYKQCFTEQELDQLLLFYKSSAGQKMSKDFMLLSFTGATAAQRIIKTTAGNLDQEMRAEGKIK